MAKQGMEIVDMSASFIWALLINQNRLLLFQISSKSFVIGCLGAS